MRKFHRDERNPRSGTSLLIEAMVLLAFLTASLAVCAGLFASALAGSRQADRLDRAVTVATDTAERFSADPTGIAESSQRNGFDVSCAVTPDQEGSGTLYSATITVSEGGDQVYQLVTARYVGGDGR